MAAFFAEVVPVLDGSVRNLCRRPYAGHPKGCPNYGCKERCPPRSPMLADVIDLQQPVFAIWNAFDLGKHVERVRAKHPTWTERQLYCCLYWQGTARKSLREKIRQFCHVRPCSGLTIVGCPEACGVNVTETMKRVGIFLEWPPRVSAIQVVLAGRSNAAEKDKEK